MGGRRLGGRTGWMVSGVLVFVAVGCSDGGKGGLPSTSKSVTSSIVATLATVGPASLPDAVEPETVATQLADPVLATWLDAALTAPLADDPCIGDLPQMDAATATAAMSIVDPVTAELMLNLDGAIGGIGAACAAGDAQAAATERDDAAALIMAIRQRIEELGR